MDLERGERIIFSGIYCGDRISSVARSRRVTQRGRLNRRTRERAIKRRVGARRIKQARDHCQQCHLAVIQLREEAKGCILTRLRDFVDAVEKGSASAAVRKRAPLEKQRGKERKGSRRNENERRRGRPEKLGPAWVRSLNIHPLAGREHPRTVAPDEGTNRPFLPLRPRPRNCSIAALFHQKTKNKISRRSSRAGREKDSRTSSLFVRGDSRERSAAVLSIFSFNRSEWRVKKSNSIILRRRSLVNGRVLGSFYGTPRLDSSWGAQALVGVSFRIKHISFLSHSPFSKNLLRACTLKLKSNSASSREFHLVFLNNFEKLRNFY